MNADSRNGLAGMVGAPAIKIRLWCVIIITFLFSACHPEAKRPSIKGQDLQYGITISPQEESKGFSRTLKFMRPAYDMRIDPPSSVERPASEHVVMPEGWAIPSKKKFDKPYHYIIKVSLKGGFGVPKENRGDLYVTVKVIE